MTESLLYYHPITGASTELNDGTIYKMIQHEGFGISDFTHFSTAVPEQHGEIWHGIRMGVKVITIDLLIKGNGIAALEDNKRALLALVNPLLVDRRGGKIAKLRLTQSNGSVRQMDCVLSEALPMGTAAHIAQRAARYQLRFRSLADPSLYDPTAQSVTFTQASSSAFAFPFSFPFTLGASGIFQITTITNPGDMPSQPVFDILGPALNPLLKNTTQGRTLGITGSIPAGQHMIIDTDPTKLTVLLNGVSRKDMITAVDYWNLLPGVNAITLDLGGTDTNTRVTVSWTNRYIGS